MQIEVHPVDFSALRARQAAEEPSLAVRKRITAARTLQIQRSGFYNAYLSADGIEQSCLCSPEDLRFLQSACEQLHLSVRAYHKVLKLGRTIADLANSQGVLRQHLEEALQYRCFDRE